MRILKLLAKLIQSNLRLFWSSLGLLTLKDLNQLYNVMALLNEQLVRIKVFVEKQGPAIDGLVSSINGLTADVAGLNKKIDDLQNSSGKISPEDQAILDGIEASADSLTKKLEAVAAAAKALDDATPPVIPDPGNPGV